MGIDVENCSVISHCQPGTGANDYRLARHHEELGVNDVSPNSVNRATRDGLITAAKQSQSAFDSAATTAFGNYYTPLIGTPWATGFRENFSRETATPS